MCTNLQGSRPLIARSSRRNYCCCCCFGWLVRGDLPFMLGPWWWSSGCWWCSCSRTIVPSCRTISFQGFPASFLWEERDARGKTSGVSGKVKGGIYLANVDKDYRLYRHCSFSSLLLATKRADTRPIFWYGIMQTQNWKWETRTTCSGVPISPGFGFLVVALTIFTFDSLERKQNAVIIPSRMAHMWHTEARDTYTHTRAKRFFQF